MFKFTGPVSTFCRLGTTQFPAARWPLSSVASSFLHDASILWSTEIESPVPLSRALTEKQTRTYVAINFTQICVMAPFVLHIKATFRLRPPEDHIQQPISAEQGSSFPLACPYSVQLFLYTHSSFLTNLVPIRQLSQILRKLFYNCKQWGHKISNLMATLQQKTCSFL